jgi:hypothetical protein
MSFVLSPNMNLSIPTVGQEPGPNYALDVNSSLTLVDQHDHSPGRGVQITPAGLNINASLSIQGNNLTNVSNLVLTAQTSSSVLQALYVKPGTETPPLQDLWYNDSAGNAVQITSGGAINAVAANIPGESFSGGTFFWKQGTGSTTPANFDIGSITLRPNVALTTNGVVLGPPSGIGSQYNINLPLLPATPSFVVINNSGVMSTITESSVLPTNSGSQGQFIRQNASGLSQWENPVVNIQVKTSSYLALTSDDLILCSGTPFTVTLYTAVGNQGITIRIKKTDAPVGNIITIQGNAAETIDGLNVVTLNTQNECVTLVSDGANWQVMDHSIPSDPLAYTPTFLGAGTVTSTNTTWERRGRNIFVRGYLTAGSPSGPVGSISLPSILTIDTSSTGINKGNTTSNPGVMVGQFASNSPNIAGPLVTATGTATNQVYLTSGYNSSGNQTPINNWITSGQASFQFEVPITGWWGT